MLKKFFSPLYALHSNINTDINKSNKNQKKFVWESPQYYYVILTQNFNAQETFKDLPKWNME